MHFDLLDGPHDIEVIAAGTSVRESPRLRRAYGGARWRKLKGVGLVRLSSGTIREAELHWYECHGVGRKEMKIKRLL